MIKNLRTYAEINGKYVLDKEKSKELTGYASIDRQWLKYYDKSAESEALPKVCIYDYIKHNNERNLSSCAVNYYHNKISYRELFDKIENMAYQLKKLGIEKGDNVPICSLSTPEMIISFLALNKIGAVPNMISPVNGDERLRQHLNSTKSKVLITMDIFSEKLNKVVNDTCIETIVNFSFSNSMPTTLKTVTALKLKLGLPKFAFNGKVISGDALIKGRCKYNVQTAAFNSNDLAAVVYTSGSTGKPKAIMLSNENFVAMMIEYSKMDIEMKKGESFMSVIPPFFPYGICNSICVPLSLGLETILIPKFDASIFPKVFMEYKPNHVNGVPKYWESLMNSPLTANANLSFLKNAGCGGAGMTDEMEIAITDFFAKHGSNSKVNKGYGASESTSAAAVATLKSNEIGSVGIPLLYTNMSIFKYDTDEEVSYLSAEEGEICISGPTVMLGYKDNEEKTREVLKLHRDGKIWYHTRDRGQISMDGAFYVNGRYGRLILRRGMSIDPADIEYELSKCDIVSDVAVVKMEHPDFVEVPVACVVLNDKAQNVENVKEYIMSMCAKTLPEYSLPYDIVPIDFMPMLESDKVDYVKLEDYANRFINNNGNVKKIIRKK